MSLKHKFIIFAIDDSHYMDPDSWEFIADLGHDNRSLVVLTLKKKNDLVLCDTAMRVIHHPSAVHIPLEGIEQQHITDLACQLLDVVKIPNVVAE